MARALLSIDGSNPLLKLVILLLIWLSLPGPGQEPPLDPLYGLGEVRYHRLHAESLDQTYHVYVRLPEEYQDSLSYPAVYLLDGGITFPIIAAYYRYLWLAEEVPTSIIVGISYGTGDWEQGNMRGRDFTAPSAERSYWGGADAFQKVLAEEIVALVERTYPADPANRVLFGQSLGGQFVLHTALTNRSLFRGYIASNPALHRNLEFFLQEARGSVLDRDPPRLFVASGSLDNPRFREPALRWMAHWRGQSHPPWVLSTRTLAGQSHFSAAPESFRLGMHWIFSYDAYIQTPTGLLYDIIVPGTGPEAASGKFALIHETTQLADGTFITDTYAMNNPVRFLIGGNQVIAGLDEGVAGMRVGERRRLVVPPALSSRSAYPEDGRLTPSDTLYYDVLLLQVTDSLPEGSE